MDGETGVPEFWLTALKTNEILNEEVCLFFCWIVVLSISDSSSNNTVIMFYLLEVLSNCDMCLPRYLSVMRRLSSI